MEIAADHLERYLEGPWDSEFEERWHERRPPRPRVRAEDEFEDLDQQPEE